MTSPQLDEEAIFKAARRAPAGEARRAYLDEICGEDGALRDRVLALLRVDEEERSFLAAPALDPTVTTDQPADDGPGTVIGSYRLMEQMVVSGECCTAGLLSGRVPSAARVAGAPSWTTWVGSVA